MLKAAENIALILLLYVWENTAGSWVSLNGVLRQIRQWAPTVGVLGLFAAMGAMIGSRM